MFISGKPPDIEKNIVKISLVYLFELCHTIPPSIYKTWQTQKPYSFYKKICSNIKSGGIAFYYAACVAFEYKYDQREMVFAIS